ncbi:MAG: peptide deformylase [bacterium]|nr:peptide deformylase [bacterium]
MSVLNIVQYPAPLLNEKSEPVTEVTPAIAQLIDDMLETMYAAPGVGLAAPQVGILKRVVVIDVGSPEGKQNPIAFVNPTIISREGKVVWEEGCLSCPNLLVPVERSQKITVEGLSKEGKKIEMKAEDLLAVAFQHEIDHLDGITLVSRLSRLKRDLYLKKLKKGNLEEWSEKTSRKEKTYIG